MGHMQRTRPGPEKKRENTCNATFVLLMQNSFFLSTTLMETAAPAGSLSRGGDVVVYVFDIHQPNLLTPFYSVLVSISVFLALSTVFHSINSPDNSPFFHSVLAVLSLPYWSFHLYMSLGKSPSTMM